ncbi:SoxR reducing system RseC family protein [Alteromonas sp. ASW11-36]|uniref:SoxR reducing system RseC family protein n=1 Tax=Alteromonas arenosi TaxID=3055817 RepID=A0ABT7SW24_9ALTE|nr:SoxR reducing system RseC family protein [Alteromonas sp. ASW11-36]MDM7859757.1 SoxR reducing system RseC family protein [Alteromonas sp. ASW11-36]
MIEEVGKVIAVERDEIIVETEIKTTCGSCEAQQNCGTGTIAKALAPRRETLRFSTELPVQVGSKVRLGIPETALLKASIWLYVIPLLGLIVGGALFSWVLPIFGLVHEGWVIASTILAALAAFVWVSATVKQRELQQYQPRLLGVILDSSEPVKVSIANPR